MQGKMKKYLKVRPYQLMCIFCQLERGFENSKIGKKLKKIYEEIKENPIRPILLVCNVKGIYSFQNPGKVYNTDEGELYNKKRDIDIIQRMGLTPGIIMPARFLIEKLLESIESTRGICGYGMVKSKIWKGCKYAESGYYEEARKKGIKLIVAERNIDECKKAKEISLRRMYKARILKIRPHHLLCMACFAGNEKGGNIIQEDNLYEAVDIIKKNLDIPIKLVEGPCMICPPCKSYLRKKIFV